MLQKLSEQARACHEYAADARQKAEAAADSASKANFLEMEKHWLALASSYASTDSIENFTAAMSDRLFDLLPVAIYVCDPDGLILFYNRRAAELWGRSPKLEDPSDRFCGAYRMYSLEGGPIAHAECPMAEVLRTGISASDQEIMIERPDGSRGIALVNIGVLKDRTGSLLGAVNCFQDITERRQNEQTIQWLASVVGTSDDAILTKSLGSIITSWNKGAERLFGYTAEEVVGKSVTILIPPDLRDEELTILERIRRGESVDHYETVRQCKEDRLISVSLTISPVKNAGGKVVGASTIARDITERKRAEAREKMLMAELDHRVKNVLNRVEMVAMSTRNSSSSVDEFTRSLKGRIQSMAAAHVLLSQKGWHGVGLEALVRSQLAPYAADANIAITGTDVILPAAAIQAMGMVLHELVTNAAKYGAFSVPTGRVTVSWDRKPNGHAANLVFAWREFGVPQTAVDTKFGYGTRLIRELVPHELGGTVDLEFVAEGVSCRIEFPLQQ
jgi:two-component system CheB/CheR fusion protein